MDRLVEEAAAGTDLSRWSLLAASRRTLDRARRAFASGSASAEPELASLVEDARRWARGLERGGPRPVINATGVILHTNLGRAPLAEGAAAAAATAARCYTDLELDLETGGRGSRLEAVGELLRLLSGAEAALVVNNAAAALLLAVDAIAAGREVILSRGELIEIGGSFRLPELLEASQARLREVGTTNRTHLRDYRSAIGPETGLLLKVHRSNFEIRGFTHEVDVSELSGLAREHGIPLVEDRGSGTFLDLSNWGIPEPDVARGLRVGADLVLFSGDKLLGGPQAGIVIGSEQLVARMRQHPLARALRVDKATLAALRWTLQTLLAGTAAERIPILGMLGAAPAELRACAERIAKALAEQGWSCASVAEESSRVGGGTSPDLEIAGSVVRVEPPEGVGRLAAALRAGDPPLLVRVHRNAVTIDPRTLLPGDEACVVAAFRRCHVDSSSWRG